LAYYKLKDAFEGVITDNKLVFRFINYQNIKIAHSLKYTRAS